MIRRSEIHLDHRAQVRVDVVDAGVVGLGLVDFQHLIVGFVDLRMAAESLHLSCDPAHEESGH